MPVVEGFEVLTGTYLGQDWDLFGTSIDASIVNYAREYPEDVPTAIAGFDELITAALSDQQYHDRWVLKLHSGYDPRDDGLTFREWFTHARDLLVAEAAKRPST